MIERKIYIKLFENVSIYFDILLQFLERQLEDDVKTIYFHQDGASYYYAKLVEAKTISPILATRGSLQSNG